MATTLTHATCRMSKSRCHGSCCNHLRKASPIRKMDHCYCRFFVGPLSEFGAVILIFDPGDNLLFNSRGEMSRANFIPKNYPTTLLILGAHDLIDVVLAVLLSEELARLVQISSLPQYLMY